VRVRRDIGDPVAFLDPKALQRRRPSIASVEKLFIRQPQVAVDDSLAAAIQLAGTAPELRGE